MRNSLKIAISSLALSFILTGCIATKSYDFKPSTQQISTLDNSKVIEYKVTDINVKIADESTRGDIDAIPDILIQNLKSELDNTIINSGIFDISSDKNISISLIINEVDSPMLSSTFPTKMTVQYMIKNDNKIIYQENIESLAETEMSFSFLGGTRQMESVNRTVRLNIINFIKSAQNKLGK